MKVYLVVEMENTGGVPPSKDRLATTLANRIRSLDTIQQNEPDSAGIQFSQNEVVRVKMLEMEP